MTILLAGERDSFIEYVSGLIWLKTVANATSVLLFFKSFVQPYVLSNSTPSCFSAVVLSI